MNLKQKDFEIIAYLRKNARDTLTTMSRRTKIPVATIFDRLRRFQQKIVAKHVSLLNFQEIGFNARANVMIKTRKENKDDFLEFVMKHPNVNSVFKINNGFDLMIDVIFRNVKGLEHFLDLIDEKYMLKTKITYYIIDELKREEFLCQGNMHMMVD